MENRMTTQEMLRTLDSCRCFQPYVSKKIIHKKPEPVDWAVRKKRKKDLFITSIKFLFALVAISCFFVIFPIGIMNPVLGKTILISMLPMLLLTLSWMVPAWIFFDRRRLVLVMTVGMSPIRIAFVVGFIYLMILAFPAMCLITFVVGMMLHWILFFIAELHMMCKYFKLPMTAEEQPEEI